MVKKKRKKKRIGVVFRKQEFVVKRLVVSRLKDPNKGTKRIVSEEFEVRVMTPTEDRLIKSFRGGAENKATAIRTVNRLVEIKEKRQKLIRDVKEVSVKAAKSSARIGAKVAKKAGKGLFKFLEKVTRPSKKGGLRL